MGEPAAGRQPLLVRFGSFRLRFIIATEAEYGENLKVLFPPPPTAYHRHRAGGSRGHDGCCSGEDGCARPGCGQKCPPVSGPASRIAYAGFSDVLPVASLSTGGDVVTGEGDPSINADMVDMETYAVLCGCQRFVVSLTGLRGISDGQEDLYGMHDGKRSLGVIDKKLGWAVMMLRHRLEQRNDLAFLSSDTRKK